MSEILTRQLEDSEAAERENQVERSDDSPETPVQSESVRRGLLELKKRQELQAAIRPLYHIHESEEFDDPHIVELTNDWAENHAANGENIAEVLKYFGLSETIISSEFSPDQRAEVACALAEIVANPANNIDAETLQALAFQIEYGDPNRPDKKSGKTFNVVARYCQEYPAIRIYDELFEKVDGGRQNISHILAHEISHGLDRYGKVGASQEFEDKLDQQIEDIEGMKGTETYRVINAIEQYSQAVGQENVSQEDIEFYKNWLKSEIRAEKIACYLESGGDLGAFLDAMSKVMPAGNRRRLVSDPAALSAWKDEQQIFFQEIQNDMANQEELKARILANSALDRKRAMELQDVEGEFDLDLDSYFEHSFAEPPQVDNSNSPKAENHGNDLWRATIAMFEVAAEKAEEIVPVSGLAKKAA